MNITHIICGVVLVLLVIPVYFCIGFILKPIEKIRIWKARPEQIKILRRHIAAVLDPQGCINGTDRFQKIAHIINHYDIDLNTAGYANTIAELKKACFDSENRYDRKQKIAAHAK